MSRKRLSKRIKTISKKHIPYYPISMSTESVTIRDLQEIQHISFPFMDPFHQSSKSHILDIQVKKQEMHRDTERRKSIPLSDGMTKEVFVKEVTQNLGWFQQTELKGNVFQTQGLYENIVYAGGKRCSGLIQRNSKCESRLEKEFEGSQIVDRQ